MRQGRQEKEQERQEKEQGGVNRSREALTGAGRRCISLPVYPRDRTVGMYTSPYTTLGTPLLLSCCTGDRCSAAWLREKEPWALIS